MSLLPPDVHAELTQLLQALQSSDNSIRSQAEEHLQNNWTNARPEVLLMGLAEQIQAASDTSVHYPQLSFIRFDSADFAFPRRAPLPL
jgi:importin-5